jgi:serine/threonine protein kinase
VIDSTYAIREELARTETGVVFVARDMLLDRDVAIKLAWRDPDMPSLLVEAKRCAAVRDPCSVAIYGVGNYNGLEYVIGERVTGRLLRDVLAPPLAPEDYLARLRTLIAAVSRAHESGVAIGDIAGSTILVDDDGRMVLGRLSLSQVPAFDPLGHIVAPEVARGDAQAHDPAAAEAIDLFGLGCVAIELACGTPPFASKDPSPVARLSELRRDLPIELADLVDELLDPSPHRRPRSARDVLAQLDTIVERVGTTPRSVRVLVVHRDAARTYALWSLARRAHPAAIVETAGDGPDAAKKLVRDQPELLFIDGALGGIMNALELCMYARGVGGDGQAQIVVIGAVSDRDRELLSNASVTIVPDDDDLPDRILDGVRTIATASGLPRARPTVSSG